MTSRPPSDAVDDSNAEAEPERDPPKGLSIEHPASGGVVAHVRIPLRSRALLALPRVVFVLGLALTIVQAWRHRVFFAFWFIGLPFVRWLFGAAQYTLTVGDETLRVDGTRWFGSPLLIQRSIVRRVEVGRGSAFQCFQRTLIARTVDDKVAQLLVGLTADQAEFLNDGLQRWLAGNH